MQETSYSLLERIQAHADREAWERLVEIYTPLLHSWLRRYQVFSAADADDLTQDVLLVVSQDLAKFRPLQQSGAFRGWLRAILVNRVRHFWRRRQHRPSAVGGSDCLDQLEQLEDGTSAMSKLWDVEHDRHVMQRLLDLVQVRFAAATWQAFCRQVLDEVPAESVARELGLSLPSVYAAKSRVLKALRTAADGLVSS